MSTGWPDTNPTKPWPWFRKKSDPEPFSPNQSFFDQEEKRLLQELENTPFAERDIEMIFGGNLEVKFYPKGDGVPGEWTSKESLNVGHDATITIPIKDLNIQVKDSNPKDAVGIKKAPLSTVSAAVMMEVGVAMMEGALKYGRHNYREIGVRASVYYDALQRHIMAWWEGQNIDKESGLSHITKAIACLMVLRDAQIRDKMVDDRPPGTKGFVEHLNKVAAELVANYPNPKDAFTADGREPEEYQP